MPITRYVFFDLLDPHSNGSCAYDAYRVPDVAGATAYGRVRYGTGTASLNATARCPSTKINPRNHHPTITPTSPNPQLQFTASFAPAATPCELHPTSAHPPHSTSHHRECCPPVRLTLRIPERMVHA